MSNTNEIGQAVFERILKDAEYDSDDGTVSVEANLGLFSIRFYGENENDYKIIVEDFGKMKNNKWIQLEPTKKQLVFMQKMLNDKVKLLEESEE